MPDLFSLAGRRAAPWALFALVASVAGCTAPAPRAEAAAAVEIDITQDADHRLVVRYRAPSSVTHLDFLLRDARLDSAARVPMMRPANDCGALVPGGLTLRHGAGCEQGAAFVVTPRAMQLDAMYEPAQPSSDGGVLLYTGYYAAAAAGLPTRWRFTPAPGDYGIDDSVRHDAAWQVEPAQAWPGARPGADPRDDDDWLTAQHAQHYVFLGPTPMSQAGGVLWVRDPQVPQAIVDSVGRAGPLAWDAYARAAGRQPEGQTAIVMLAMAPGMFGYHGDRTEGRMLRLSFARGDQHADSSAGTFVAHETAHLWNHGVFRSDMARPWLHEGDADWVALNAMHEAGLLSDSAFVERMQSHIVGCLATRGERAAVTMPPGRAGDDPYGCGFALQLLGYARVHAAHPEATPLATWGALHRAHPALDVAGFAQFFDNGQPPMFGALLLDAKVPFASTYRADLAAYVPLHEPAGEPAPGSPRRRAAIDLMSALGNADCGRLGFGLDGDDDHGEFVLDTDLRCQSLPAGARVATLAGVPVVAQPLAAWRAVRQSCAAGGHVEAGLRGHAAVTLACPSPMPAPPPQFALPDDVLARLGLTKKTS